MGSSRQKHERRPDVRTGRTMFNPFEALTSLAPISSPSVAVLGGLICAWIGWRLSCKAPPKPNPKQLDPVGGTPLKNLLGLGMAKIAQTREQAHASWSLKELEGFHAPDIHPFWNESYYFNGCDLNTHDRIITRISHRGINADKSYVFLLLDLKQYGYLTLEEDDVDWKSEPNALDGNPRANGLTYECIDPMQTWRLTYDGVLTDGHKVPWLKTKNTRTKHVKLDLTYCNDTPTFWYMRDDASDTLAKNLSQEAWGLDFIRYCLARSKNHCHIEAWGSMKGTIAVDHEPPVEYNFGTFRDHSWDIRLWAAIDQLFILLLTFEEPLIIQGKEYWYLDLTLVHMPNNSGGVQRYTTGWLGTKDAAGGKATGSLTGNLPVTHATSILNIGYTEEVGNEKQGIPSRRFPLEESRIAMHVGDAVGGKKVAEVLVECTGAMRTLQYWPDHARFEVFEIEQQFLVNGVRAYGTRQEGFRLGAYDPTEGGCG